MLTLLSAAGLVKFVRRPSDNLFVFVENPNLAGIKSKVLVCDKKMTLAAWQTRHTSFCSTLCRTLDYSRVAFGPRKSVHQPSAAVWRQVCSEISCRRRRGRPLNQAEASDHVRCLKREASSSHFRAVILCKIRKRLEISVGKMPIGAVQSKNRHSLVTCFVSYPPQA